MLISICIPTYNSGIKLQRLLDSIIIQTFKNYEIIISDDSKNQEVESIVKKYSEINIKYFKNTVPFGTPGNWNNAISKSTGDWIKLMHHDDWFFDENSLSVFVNTIQNNKNSEMVICAYQNVFFDKGIKQKIFFSKVNLFLLKVNSLNLFKTFLGNPSCTIINSKCLPYKYDEKFKWLIDFDFFTEFFKKNSKIVCLNKILINLGMDSTQVTASVFQNPNVEVPESMNLLYKHGTIILKNIFVYDFFWRLYRNTNIRGQKMFDSYLGYDCDIASITTLVASQEKISQNYLKIGVVSKFFMTVSYIKNYFSK